MIGTEICMLCNDKNHNQYETALQHLERIVSRSKEDNTDPISFNWDISTHCRYGITCPILRQTDQKAQMRASQLESRMAYIARYDTGSLYHSMMQGLRGYFPRVSHILEIEHHKYTERREQLCETN